MNKHMSIIGLVICALVLVAMPACRKKSREEKRQEKINTMIEVNEIEEAGEESVESNKGNLKF